MEKINFEAGTQVSPAKVTIDNVEHEVTPSVWEGNTPLSPFVLNKMQSNIENAISESGVIVSATEPTGANREKLWLQHKNILFQNSDEWQQGTISSESGTIVDSTTRIRTSNFIEVESNTEHIFTINNNNCKFLIFEYTSDETFIKSTDWITSAKYKYITSETGHKIKIIISHTDNSTIETSEISTIKLNLSNTQSKIYVLNDNNVYEEFIQKEQIKKVTQNLTLNTTYAKGGTVNYIKSNNIVQAYMRLDLKAVSTAASYINIASGLLFKPLTELKIYANLLSNNEAILSNNILVQIRTDGAIYLKTTASYANNSLVMITFTYITGD